MKKLFLLVIVALLLATLLACGCGGTDESSDSGGVRTSAPESTAPAVDEEPVEPAGEQFVQENFQERRTINFVSSDPANNALLTTPPERVTVNFDYNLGSGSFITVTRNGLEVSEGPMVISEDLRSVSVSVDAGETGNYKVDYAAYFSTGYYEEGSFGFSVDLQQP